MYIFLGQDKCFLKKRKVIGNEIKTIKKYRAQTTSKTCNSVLKCLAIPSITGKRAQADRLRSIAFTKNKINQKT